MLVLAQDQGQGSGPGGKGTEADTIRPVANWKQGKMERKVKKRVNFSLGHLVCCGVKALIYSLYFEFFENHLRLGTRLLVGGSRTAGM